MKNHWQVLFPFAMAVVIALGLYLSFGTPIACGSYGCIRASDLHKQQVYTAAFAQATNGQVPREAQVLTTLLRRYLLTHSLMPSAVSLEDARAYRTDVLHTTNITTIQELGFSSFDEYDEFVVIPFLQQEALMKQRHLDTPDALYAQLAQEHVILFLKPDYHWNKSTGEVVVK